jgi:transcription termination factor Rho
MPGRGDRGTRGPGGNQPGGYGQPGYIVPGYGVPDYGMPPYGGPSERGQRPGHPRMRAPVPPLPPARSVEVQGVLWVRGSTAELLDERGTLAALATMSAEEVRRQGLRAGDVVRARAEERGSQRRVVAVEAVNGRAPEEVRDRPLFEQLTAISPRQRITLERGPRPLSARIIDLFAPLGFGARALVVAPPKTGKTTFLRETAESVLTNYPDVLVMACLVGERPEEVTDLRAALEPRGGLVYAASFDEVQERHAWLVQVTIERAKRVAESGGNVVVLLDSLTRLARAENLTGRAMGRTLSGGIDAQALDTGRRAFGAARCLEEGGSLTIMATCLVDTGSRQDDVVYEEFKGTGNMEIYLSRELSQRRLFPAVDAVKSGTRKEELLLSPEELKAATALRRRLADMPLQQATTQLLSVLEQTPSNAALLQAIERTGWASAMR